ALIRLGDARAWAENYRDEVIPNLTRARRDLERLFAAGDQSVDVLKLIDVQRNLLKAYDGYLDALNEVAQARADLAAAGGDPSPAVPSSLAAQTPAPPALPSAGDKQP